jgi:hypothetical protein
MTDWACTGNPKTTSAQNHKGQVRFVMDVDLWSEFKSGRTLLLLFIQPNLALTFQYTPKYNSRLSMSLLKKAHAKAQRRKGYRG